MWYVYHQQGIKGSDCRQKFATVNGPLKHRKQPYIPLARFQAVSQVTVAQNLPNNPSFTLLGLIYVQGGKIFSAMTLYNLGIMLTNGGYMPYLPSIGLKNISLGNQITCPALAL